MYAMNSLPAKPAIETHSTAFANKDEYGIVVYLKTAIWMSILESSLGKENLLNGLKEYFQDMEIQTSLSGRPENIVGKRKQTKSEAAV